MCRQPVAQLIEVDTPLELNPPGLRCLRHRIDRVGAEPAVAVARAGHYEDRRSIEHPVELSEKGLARCEDLAPGALHHIPREDYGVGPSHSLAPNAPADFGGAVEYRHPRYSADELEDAPGVRGKRTRRSRLRRSG